MRLGVLVANGLVLAGIGAMALMGAGEQQVAPVLSAAGAGSADVAALERAAADAPTLEATAALANAYLDRDQPGLASAVLDRAPRAVRERPEIAQIYARALFHRGHAREALAFAEAASDACSAGGCPAWLVATTSHEVAFLGEMVAAGIEDPLRDPAATRAAYERSVREVRLVAMR
ncbi:MAG TPA: hypothetical protein VHB21_05930 [Minicystis sp.]|nr:hypothetical protein [Minicystis sp.]